MSSIKKALTFSSAGQYIVQVFGIIGTVLYSRLLSPEEIGYFVVGMGVFSILNEIRSLGVGQYLSRESHLPELMKEQVFGTCLSTTIITFVVINSLAFFYEAIFGSSPCLSGNLCAELVPSRHLSFIIHYHLVGTEIPIRKTLDCKNPHVTRLASDNFSFDSGRAKLYFPCGWHACRRRKRNPPYSFSPKSRPALPRASLCWNMDFFEIWCRIRFHQRQRSIR